jgi:NTP pyrophosphatase (non-canonical NTP hydrolase)
MSNSYSAHMLLTSRAYRQSKAGEWVTNAFGDNDADVDYIGQRGLRVVEEALELGQAVKVPREMVHKLVDAVYDKPVGELAQEMGGVSITLLALAHFAEFDIDEIEVQELMRVLDKPLSHFRARNKAKCDAGFTILKKAGE